MNMKDTLVAFGEFLDSGRACYDPRHGPTDDLTHEEVAEKFLDWWAENPNRAVLPGPQPDRIIVQISDGVFAEDDVLIATRLSNGKWYGRNVRMEDLA